MKLTRQEVRFDFKGARFDLTQEWDRRFLAWVFNQFLYGEVTGIQCGHWLYHSPQLQAASFIAKQAGEELSHVRKILRIFSLLGEKPGPAHPAIRFLTTGMMGGSWGEHVTLEMAVGEGLVLAAFYAMADTIDHPEIHRILETAITEEERHVEFGERETEEWLRRHPGDRNFLLSQALVQWLALGWIKRSLARRLQATRNGMPPHPVLGQFDSFYDHVLAGMSQRVKRLGLATQALQELSFPVRAYLLGTLPLRWVGRKVFGFLRRSQRKLLTDTYLEDPWLMQESDRYKQSTDEKHAEGSAQA
jgi:hypothetical protein